VSLKTWPHPRAALKTRKWPWPS